MAYTFAEAVALVIAGGDLIRFGFDTSGNGVQYYVNGFEATAVPLPAAAPLLLAGFRRARFCVPAQKSQIVLNCGRVLSKD